MKLTLIALAAAAVTACAPAVPDGEFLIVGEIENVPDSARVMLIASSGKCIAGDTVIGGRFSLRDTVSLPKAAKISLHAGDYAGGELDIWVASGTCTKIRGEGTQAWLWEVLSEIPEQQDEDVYRALVEPETRELNRYQGVLTEQEVARFMELCGRISEKTVRHMQTAPVTEVWIRRFAECARWLPYGIGVGQRARMLALYDRMTEEQRRSSAGREIAACLKPIQKVGIGDRMADGDLYDVDGNRRRLSEFLGKYILLEFGREGCGACLEAIPELKEVAERYRDRIEVVSISADPESDWKRFVAERRLTGNRWNQLLGTNEGLWASYGVLGVPHYVLIAPDGRIADMWSGYGRGSLSGKLRENIE